jgi:glutathione S-transferase
VYKTGFATTQEDYEAVVVPLFNSLDRLEKMLTGKDYLVGDTLTEADVRLWVTIVGFVINGHVLLLTCTIDSFRSCLCRPLQVQLPYHSKRLPRYPLVRHSISISMASTLTTLML